MAAEYFFDTSALIRIFEGDPSMEPLRGVGVTVDTGILFEFTRYLVKTRNARAARRGLDALKCTRAEASSEALVTAAKILMAHPRLSSRDAVAYATARELGLTLVTTDRALAQLPGVESVGAL